MNCEKCQELLSDFLEGALSSEEQSVLGAHLEECLSCFSARDELNSIVTFCREHRGEYDAVPNERALWLGIRNVIESEQHANLNGVRAAHDEPRERWWSGLFNRSWEFSFSQLAASVVALALAVSLVTAFSLRRRQEQSNDTASATNANAARTASANQGSIEDRVSRQQMAIDYWNQRVEQRKAQWNPQMREAFERNLRVLDQAVADHHDVLLQNPQDEVSKEMLDAALTDKMEFLMEFSEL